MVAKEKRNLLNIKRPNKREKLRQMTSYHAKFLKDGSPKDGVKNTFATSTCNTI
jgi:hypothetical protein